MGFRSFASVNWLDFYNQKCSKTPENFYDFLHIRRASGSVSADDGCENRESNPGRFFIDDLDFLICGCII